MNPQDIKNMKDTLDSISTRLSYLENDRISYTMPHDVRDNVQKAVISGTQYIGAISGVVNPVNEAFPSFLQVNFNGKIWNVPMSISITSGTGAPVFDASKGTLYSRTDAPNSGTRLYVNTDGGTTWATIAASA